ncbi:sperm flagellar protein 1-like [Heterocephalus glaber]|uniref:Sperm flagellar protein 1-like n=1 Tax=Heterocephalus glaber TaxID=10181 RepID=A0AAX6QQL1_HETGA|nr:sperm flagellar protein 1-like [Heterocephalus glaber]
MPGASGLRPTTPSQPLLLGLCGWLDRFPLSRPKRHLARDFSDGVLVAEIVKHFHPRLVDLHNYIPASNTDQKLSNWSLLNRKVFHKLHFCVSEADIRKVVASVPGAIEPILCALREKVEAGTVHAVSPGTADPGLSSVDADQPLVEVPTHTYTGLPDSPDPSSVKTLHNQRALKKMDCCACLCGDPAKGAWEHLARVQQLLEDKEQALAILQQIVQILQMKVVRLEHLVQLKDQRIEELMRPGPRE